MMQNSSTSVPTVYLVALDAMPSRAHVLQVAIGLAVSLGGKAELHFAHVLGVGPAVSVMGMGTLVPTPELLDAGKNLLDDACAQGRTRFEGRIEGHLLSGEPWREITQLAADLRCDLIVVGTAGRTGLARLALGSVAEKVMRNAGCPVLVVRPKDFHEPAVPEIEPPCVDCLKVQDETARATLWCTRHATRQSHGRLHYELPPTFGMGSMLVRP
jgi:nucleotide-binding universal stress UspA family protein